MYMTLLETTLDTVELRSLELKSLAGDRYEIIDQ